MQPRIVLSFSLGLAAATISGCSRDELAPDCFYRDSGNVCIAKPPGLGELSLTCGAIPTAAVGAELSYTPMVTGGAGSYDWSATGLPPGLAIDMSTGAITGMPSQAGSFDLTITVDDDLDASNTDTTVCTLVVNPKLGVDVSNSPINGCAPYDSDVRAFVDLDNTGTGNPAVTCRIDVSSMPNDMCPIENGAGRMPEGLTWDESTCTATGTITDEYYGVWAWLVELEQDGVIVHLPVCAQNDNNPYHSVVANVIDMDGGMISDPLQPSVARFDPTQPLAVDGSDPNAYPGPSFQVRGPAADCANGLCDFTGYKFETGCSPFEPPFSADPVTLVPGEGFDHGMVQTTAGNSVDSYGNPVGEFADRAWIAPWRFWYCTSDSVGVCDDTMIKPNSQTKYHTALIAYPQ